MKEIIDRILEGKFEYENGSLEFSESRVEITLEAGEDYEGSFRIIGNPKIFTEGFLYTSDARMECLTERFSGMEEEIGYVFHGKGLEEGDVLKGNFYIVSNQGEYELPFVVMVSHETVSSSMGAVKNLFHFTNLAKSHWKEAVRLFYSPKFESLFEGNDRKYRELYRGLSRYYGNEHNVEEFLIAIHKKQKVQYIIDEDKFRLEVSEGVSRHEVLLTRNGWGYPYLQAEAAGDFIVVDKNMLNDDDFLGNRCIVYYYINAEKLHKGINFGRLRFYNSFVEVSVPVEVSRENTEYRQESFARKKQEMLVSMMEYYSAFRMKKISTGTWLQKNYEIVDNWIEEDDNDPEPRLYRTHLLITEGRMNEAGWTLEKARNTILQSSNFDNAIWCYYLYLSILRKREESYVNKVTADVADAYEKDPDNWRLGWLLLYLSPEYNTSYSRKWIFIREQFERGCTSPVFYIEALLLMRLEPSLFMELGAFEMQVLRYAAKHDLLTDDIVMQLHYLAPRMHHFSESLLFVLKKSYEKRKSAETLQNICTMMISGNCRKTEDFPWYAAGVEENLRITRLYEYYMYSLDRKELIKLPKVIYMYFAYHNTLDWERSAYLYASLLQNRESLPDLYEKEYFHIQEYTVRMIQEGRINEHLAFLYEQLVAEGTLAGEVGEKLAPLLFSMRIKVEDKRLRRLIVLYPKEMREKSYALVNGQAILPLYGKEYTLLSEDSGGNRYALEEGVVTERLFSEDKRILEAERKDFQTLSLQMYLCDNGSEMITAENIRRYERILACEEVPAIHKQTMIPGMAQFYYDNDRMEELDSFLDRLQPEILDNTRRGEMVRFLIVRDKPEQALEWIRKYGMEAVDVKTLLRLSSKMIQRSNQVEDKTILSLCVYTFMRGKYDLATLKYLMDYYQGNTKMMRDIWKAAREKGLDTHSFSERILEQILYSGCFVGEKTDIFRSYLEKETDPSLEKAFLYQCCYDYFVKEKVTEKVVFDDLEKLLRQGEPLQKVCLLAYTRYYAEHKKEIHVGRRKLLKECLLKLMEDGAVLSYFSEYTDICTAMGRFRDKTILEHRTRPGRRAIVYYRIEEEEAGEEYKKAEMKEVYEGVYCSMFVLFFGEKLFYYIMEEYDTEDGRQKELAGSGELSGGDKEQEKQEGRFHLLNDIVTAHVLQDYDTLEHMLLEYENTDYIQERLFTLL